MAVSTCDGSTAPEEHAAPTEQAETFQVQRDDQSFAVDSRKHDVSGVRECVARVRHLFTRIVGTRESSPCSSLSRKCETALCFAL